MVQATQKAIIRKAAPSFSAQAWYQDKFQTVNLEQFRGKFAIFDTFSDQLTLLRFVLHRQVRCPLLLAS